jgi:hypothetical protein
MRKKKSHDPAVLADVVRTRVLFDEGATYREGRTE